MKKIEENLNELLEVFDGTGIPNKTWVKDKLEETLIFVKTRLMDKQEQSNEQYSPLDVVDLSWMWHCSDDPKNILDYTELVKDSKIASALNITATMGFRFALKKMEKLELIEMGDIDRSPKHSDQLKWDESFNCG